MTSDREAEVTSRTDDVMTDVAALYLEHRDHLYRVARAMAGAAGYHLAEDAIQDVFSSLMRRYPADVANWRGYLTTSVRNQMTTLLTTSAARRELANTEKVAEVLEDRADNKAIEGDPAVEGERRDLGAIVRQAVMDVRQVDPQAADALWLTKALGYTSAEVADQWGISDSRVRQLVARGRDLVKTILIERGVK